MMRPSNSYSHMPQDRNKSKQNSRKGSVQKRIPERELTDREQRFEVRQIRRLLEEICFSRASNPINHLAQINLMLHQNPSLLASIGFEFNCFQTFGHFVNGLARLFGQNLDQPATELFDTCRWVFECFKNWGQANAILARQKRSLIERIISIRRPLRNPPDVIFSECLNLWELDIHSGNRALMRNHRQFWIRNAEGVKDPLLLLIVLTALHNMNETRTSFILNDLPYFDVTPKALELLAKTTTVCALKCYIAMKTSNLNLEMFIDAAHEPTVPKPLVTFGEFASIMRPADLEGIMNTVWAGIPSDDATQKRHFFTIGRLIDELEYTEHLGEWFSVNIDELFRWFIEKKVSASALGAFILRLIHNRPKFRNMWPKIGNRIARWFQDTRYIRETEDIFALEELVLALYDTTMCTYRCA